VAETELIPFLVALQLCKAASGETDLPLHLLARLQTILVTRETWGAKVNNDYFIYIKDFILTFTSILYEAMPFIVLGALLAGILEEFVPQRLITRFLPKSRLLSICIGGLLGLIFPMCECGIIPVMRRLLRKGLPLSCCIAYLLAGPIINLVVIASTWAAFSNFKPSGAFNYQISAFWMVGLRVGLGYLVAVTTALIVDRVHRKYGDELLTPLAKTAAPDDEAEDQKKGLFKRLSNISETALHDFIDITVYLCLGAILAASVRLWLTHDRIEVLSRDYSILAIVLMMGVAILLCLCSEADAFVAASFTKLVPAAKVAFLVLGPMMDFKLYFMYTRVFRRRLIWTIITSVVVQVFVYSMLLHLLWETRGPGFMGITAESVSASAKP
jgi:uncharacterized membrane protein YraQ (UPF0718 family)